MLNHEFIGATIAPCLSNSETLQEYFSEFLDSLQFSDMCQMSMQEFKKMKSKIQGLQEEYEEEEDEEVKDMIVLEDYIDLLNSLSPSFTCFTCHEGDGSHGYWVYIDTDMDFTEFPENVLEKLFPADYKELITPEDFEKCKGYEFEKFEGKRIVKIISLDALFCCVDGIFTKI